MQRAQGSLFVYKSKSSLIFMVAIEFYMCYNLGVCIM